MKTQKCISFILAGAFGLFLFFAVNISSSKAQQIISYQGVVTNNGTPLQNTHSVTLSIYTVSSGGTAIYEETQSAVIFTDGLFNILIGSDKANPLPIFDAGSYSGTPRLAPDYFLGISIDGSAELTPRSELGSSPTSWSSQFADSSRASSTAATALNLSPNAGGVVTSVNTLSGAVTLSGGGGTTVTSNGQTITISSSGTGGTGIQGIQNTDGTINITAPTGPTATISVNPSKVQSRITGVAPSGSFITGINQDGTVNSAAPSGGITGSGTNGTISLWTGASTLGNSKLTDNGTTLSYAGTNTNTTSAYQIGGSTVVSIAGGNTILGYEAGNASMTGGANTFTGYQAGHSNTTGILNTFTGNAAGQSNTSGSYNTFAGNASGESTTTGDNNTFTGNKAGYSNTTGGSNTFSGYESGYTNTTGGSNTFSGYECGFTNTTGTANTFSGYNAGQANSTGSYNTAMGFDAGQFTEGADNTFMGFNAGITNLTGSDNTTIGFGADMGAPGLTNATAVGSRAVASASNTMVFGSNSVVGWGFGASSSTGKALVVGTNTSNGNGAYLTTGGTWTNASSRSFKDRFQTINGAEILSKIADLDLRGWYYKGTNEYHIGPVAEDFFDAFKTGDRANPSEAEKSVSSVDPAGVALVGIQELKKENDKLREEVISLQKEMARIKALVESERQ